MSYVRQTCPACRWERFVRVPETEDREFDDLIARHVGRSLQWEWLAHWEDEHEDPDTAEYVLISVAFADWVKQEGAPSVPQETPPSEGGGETVKANPYAITPHQAKQLSDALTNIMTNVADSIQQWAEHAIPAIRAAQDSFTKSIQTIVESQRPRAGCECGVLDDHQPGQEGCPFKPTSLAELTTAKSLADAAKLAPGARSPQFWQTLYGLVPAVHVQRDLADGAPVELPLSGAARQQVWERLYGRAPLLPEDAKAWREWWEASSPASGSAEGVDNTPQ